MVGLGAGSLIWFSREVIESRFPRLTLDKNYFGAHTITKVGESFELYQKDLQVMQNLLLLFTSRSGEPRRLKDDENDEDKDDKNRGDATEEEQPLLTEMMLAPLAKRMKAANTLGLESIGDPQDYGSDY